jgi:rfaE bifunctional protein nucleotidyltransferase chain/domain
LGITFTCIYITYWSVLIYQDVSSLYRKMKAEMARFYERDQLLQQRQEWRSEGKKVVFTNGCYDILHPGHIRLLERARSLGDVLVLALNTDASVRRLKGPSRPFFDEQTRAELALHLECVDAVTLFDEDTPRELIAALVPDVLVKGADWAHFIAGREEVEAAGGQVFALPLESGYSTTDLAETVLRRYSAVSS